MAKQIIAVDIDGVLADWCGFGVPKLNKILDKNVQIDGNISFDIHKAFGVSKKRMNWAYDELYRQFSIKEAKPVKGAQAAIDHLSEHYELIAITARPKKFWNETAEWIKQYFDKEIVIHFGTGAGKPVGGEIHLDNKLFLCEKYNAKYLIEDNPAEILAALKTSTKPLCHAWPWNSVLDNHPNVPRGNWNYLIKYLENEKNRH